MTKTWHTVKVNAASKTREAVEYGLMEAGAIGTETLDLNGRGVCVIGYLDAPVDAQHFRLALERALRLYNLPPSSIIEFEVGEIPDRDWLAEWKKDWQPLAVGQKFIIAPPWSEIDDASDRIVIRIEPGMAFGTGSHETTRLCLKAIEKYFRGGSFLDVGTGTGILAIAAAKLFPEARVEACDTDAGAIAIARENTRLNRVESISFRVGSVDGQTASADLVTANLTALVIVELFPELLKATCGRLILSGILEAQLDLIESRLNELGVTDFDLDSDGEWIAIVI